MKTRSGRSASWVFELAVPVPLVAAIVVLIAATPTAVTTATAQASCDPIQTQPVYDAAIPTGEDVFSPPFEIGSQEVTSAQSNDYIAAVDAASDRVDLGDGRDVRAGRPAELRDRGLAAAT